MVGRSLMTTTEHALPLFVRIPPLNFPVCPSTSYRRAAEPRRFRGEAQQVMEKFARKAARSRLEICTFLPDFRNLRAHKNKQERTRINEQSTYVCEELPL